MSEKPDTLRASIYVSDKQDPKLLQVLRELEPLSRSAWIREACNAYLPTEESPPLEEPEAVAEPEPQTETPASPLGDLLADLEEEKDEL